MGFCFLYVGAARYVCCGQFWCWVQTIYKGVVARWVSMNLRVVLTDSLVWWGILYIITLRTALRNRRRIYEAWYPNCIGVTARTWFCRSSTGKKIIGNGDVTNPTDFVDSTKHIQLLRAEIGGCGEQMHEHLIF